MEFVNNPSLFEESHHNQKGRILVAASNLPKGTTILRDPVLLFYPNKDAIFKFCQHCGREMYTESPVVPVLCSKCSPSWSKREREVLEAAYPDAKESTVLFRVCLLLHTILALRKEDLDHFASLDVSFPLHPNDNATLWRKAKDIISPLLNDQENQRLLYLEKLFLDDLSLVTRVIGTNCFSSRDSQDGACGIFLQASLLSHSCQPNCSWIYDLDNRILEIKTTQNIPKGEELTVSYIPVSDDSQARKKILQQQRGFDCCCQLCGSTIQ